jgi:hypothetical protein
VAVSSFACERADASACERIPALPRQRMPRPARERWCEPDRRLPSSFRLPACRLGQARRSIPASVVHVVDGARRCRAVLCAATRSRPRSRDRLSRVETIINLRRNSAALRAVATSWERQRFRQIVRQPPRARHDRRPAQIDDRFHLASAVLVNVHPRAIKSTTPAQAQIVGHGEAPSLPPTDPENVASRARRRSTDQPLRKHPDCTRSFAGRPTRRGPQGRQRTDPQTQRPSSAVHSRP